MLDYKTILVCAGAAVILGVIIFYAVRDIKKDKIIAMLNERLNNKDEYIARLYSELKKAKGIDKPFIVPLDYIPDFDIEAVFKAAEEEAKEEAATEEAEEGGAA